MLVSAGSARGSKTALRIEQEHARRHDLFTFSQPLANLDAIRQLGADPHEPRLELIADGDEHVLLQTRVDHGIARHGDDVLSGGFEHGRSVQAGSEKRSAPAIDPHAGHRE